MECCRLILILAFSVLLSACDSPEDKYANFIQSGHQYYDNQDFNKARLEYKNAAKIMPSDHKVIYYLGLVEEADGHLQKALSAYLTAEQQAPDFIPVILKLAEFYLTANMHDEVLPRLERVLNAEPNNAMAHALKASIFLKQKNYSKSQSEIDKALAIDGKNIVAYSVQTGLYLSKSQPFLALETIQKAIAFSPDNVSLYLLAAAVYTHQRDWNGVIEAYEAIFKINPDRLELRFNLANILLENDELNEAEAVYRDAIRDFPESLNAKSYLIIFLEKERGFDIAETQIKQFIETYPQQEVFKLWLSDLYINNDFNEKAVQTLKSVITNNPESEVSLNASADLARIQLGQGDLLLAEKLVNKILDSDASSHDALLLRANLAFKKGDYQNAVSDLRSVLQDGSNSLKAYRILAEVLVKQDRLDLAVDTLIQATGYFPEDISTLVRLSQLYALRNNAAKANEILDAIYISDPANPLIHETIARLAIERDDLDRAKLSVNQLVNIKGQELTAIYLQGRILQKSGDRYAAIKLFEDIIRSDISSPIAAYALSSLVEGADSHDNLKSIKDFLLGLPQKSASLYTIVGEIERSLGQQEKADEAFKKSISHHPHSQAPFIALAKSFYEQQDSDGALELLKQANDLVPSDITASMMQAQILTEQGQVKDALDIYELLLNRENESDVVANNYAQTLADYADDDEELLNKARILAERFINSNNPYYLDTLGWVYYKQGLLAQAETILERAIALLDHNNSDIREHYRVVLMALDKPEEAKKYLE